MWQRCTHVELIAMGFRSPHSSSFSSPLDSGRQLRVPLDPHSRLPVGLVGEVALAGSRQMTKRRHNPVSQRTPIRSSRSKTSPVRDSRSGAPGRAPEFSASLLAPVPVSNEFPSILTESRRWVSPVPLGPIETATHLNPLRGTGAQMRRLASHQVATTVVPECTREVVVKDPIKDELDLTWPRKEEVLAPAVTLLHPTMPLSEKVVR